MADQKPFAGKQIAADQLEAMLARKLDEALARHLKNQAPVQQPGQLSPVEEELQQWLQQTGGGIDSLRNQLGKSFEKLKEGLIQNQDDFRKKEQEARQEFERGIKQTNDGRHNSVNSTLNQFDSRITLELNGLDTTVEAKVASATKALREEITRLQQKIIMLEKARREPVPHNEKTEAPSAVMPPSEKESQPEPAALPVAEGQTTHGYETIPAITPKDFFAQNKNWLIALAAIAFVAISWFVIKDFLPGKKQAAATPETQQTGTPSAGETSPPVETDVPGQSEEILPEWVVPAGADLGEVFVEIPRQFEKQLYDHFAKIQAPVPLLAIRGLKDSEFRQQLMRLAKELIALDNEIATDEDGKIDIGFGTSTILGKSGFMLQRYEWAKAFGGNTGTPFPSATNVYHLWAQLYLGEDAVDGMWGRGTNAKIKSFLEKSKPNLTRWQSLAQWMRNNPGSTPPEDLQVAAARDGFGVEKDTLQKELDSVLKHLQQVHKKPARHAAVPIGKRTIHAEFAVGTDLTPLGEWMRKAPRVKHPDRAVFMLWLADRLGLNKFAGDEKTVLARLDTAALTATQLKQEPSR